VIDDEAVVAFVHFQEHCAAKPLAGSELDEPSSDKMRKAFRVDKCHNLIFRHKRVPSDFEGACGENGTLEFDDGQLFRQIARQALDACGDELVAVFVRNLQRFPVPVKSFIASATCAAVLSSGTGTSQCP
jgi:hypothetical protein